MSYHADKPNFLEICVKMAKMTLKVKVNGSHFQYHLRVPGCMFAVNLGIPAQICDELSCRQDKVTDGQADGPNDRQTQETTTPSAWKAKG